MAFGTSISAFFIFHIYLGPFLSTRKKIGRRSFYILIFAMPKGGWLVFWPFARRKVAISRNVGRRESGEAAFEISPKDASAVPK